MRNSGAISSLVSLALENTYNFYRIWVGEEVRRWWSEYDVSKKVSWKRISSV